MSEATTHITHTHRPRPNGALSGRRQSLAGVIAAMTILGHAVSAAAQETREGQIVARQTEKAAALRPYEPQVLERRLDKIDNLLFAPQRRFYPFVGSVFGGGGLAVGPGYRTPFADGGAIAAHAAWSVRNVRAAALTVRLPGNAGRRTVLTLHADWLNAPDVAFYGIGNDSLSADRGSVAYRSTTAGLTSRVQATRLLAVGAGVTAVAIATGVTGEAEKVRPSYVRSHLFAEVDSRESALFSRRGGLYRAAWSDFRQTNGSAYEFSRLDVEAQQFIPVMRETWIIALRALGSSTATHAGSVVPAVLLPDLGGTRTLRGYPSWRFRDRHRLLFTGEYRWNAGPFLDMALFVDAGTVAARVRDLDTGRLTTTYGIGASFHTTASTLFRIELARTRDGNSLLLALGPSF